MVWVARTESQAFAAIHDLPAHAQGDRSDSVFEDSGCNRVKIPRSRHPRDVGIKPRTVLRSDDLLQNDSHLLFFQPVRSGSYIGCRMLSKCGGVYEFDGLHQLLQAYQTIRMMYGQLDGVFTLSDA